MQIAYRSFLFVPGNHGRKLAKAFDAGADAVIVDLEDAVAISEKEATRAVVVEALRRPRPCPAYVRVNAMDTPFCHADLAAVAGPWLDGIVLPKVSGAWQVRAVDWLLSALERDSGLGPGRIDLMPIIETGEGLGRIDEIAAAKGRMRRLVFGAGDFTLDMGMRWTLDEQELDPYRARLLLASRAAGLEPPIDTVWVELAETAALEASAAKAARMGFQGKLCIHPAQIPIVHRHFTPTEQEVARARRILAAFAEAEARGSASIRVDGGFVDYPIVEKARRVLALAERVPGA